MIEPAYTYKARVIRWVDGDTVWLEVDLGFRMTTQNDFRLYGVNTPERGKPGFEEATFRVNQLAPVGTEVLVKTYRVPDKYGRWLVLMLADQTEGSKLSVNQSLVDEKLAVGYYGKTKV